MWPLSYFESDTSMITEIMNPPTWDGVLLCAIAFLLFGGIAIWTRRRQGDPVARAAVMWLALPALLLAYELTPFAKNSNVRIANIAFPLLAILATIATLLFLSRVIRRSSSFPGRAFLIAGHLPALALPAAGLAALFYSFAYHLPASYAPEQRDQLRMIRRILEIQPHAFNHEAGIVPLSDVRLERAGREWIPDSLRLDGAYQGYQYTLHADTPTSGRFTLDVVPIAYRSGAPSFHAFPVNPGDAQVLYCITMADRMGVPATAEDRHFHAKGPLDWIR